MIKHESMIQLIFDEMGANKSMIFRIQGNKNFISEKESLYLRKASAIDGYVLKIENKIPEILRSFDKKIENFKALDKLELGKKINLFVSACVLEINKLFSENAFENIKTFNQGLQQFNQKIMLGQQEISKLQNCQGFDEIEIRRKMESVYSSIRTLSKTIHNRLKTYAEFEKFLNTEVFLFCQVSMLDKDLNNFDVAYSFDKIDPDNFAFLNSEVYRIIKNKTIPEFKNNLDVLKSDYELFFSKIKDNDLYYFLNHNEIMSSKKDILLRNDFLYYSLSTSYYLELINKFKEAEKKIYKRLFQLNKIMIKIQVLNSKLSRPLNESELMILIFSKILKINFVNFMMLSDADYELELIDAASNTFRSEIPYGKIISNMIIPYKLFKLITKDQSLKIWDLWRHEFVIKNYKGKKDESHRFVLTGKEISRKSEILQEAIFIHLAEEHVIRFKEDSKQIVLSRENSVVVQNNMTVDASCENSFKISIQFSFILENSIIAAKNMKFA